jgi:hypothetical protein
MGEMQNAYIIVRKPEGRDLSGDLCVEESNIKIYRKQSLRMWTGFIWLTAGSPDRFLRINFWFQFRRRCNIYVAD